MDELVTRKLEASRAGVRIATTGGVRESQSKRREQTRRSERVPISRDEREGLERFVLSAKRSAFSLLVSVVKRRERMGLTALPLLDDCRLQSLV